MLRITRKIIDFTWVIDQVKKFGFKADMVYVFPSPHSHHVHGSDGARSMVFTQNSTLLGRKRGQIH